MNRRDLARELVRGTELVVEAASGRIDIQDLVTRYDNFFHYNALDGHEAAADAAALLRDFAEAVLLHEAVQTEVVDRLYLGQDAPEQYVAAGRLLEGEAAVRLRQIAEAHGAVTLLGQLRGEAS